MTELKESEKRIIDFISDLVQDAPIVNNEGERYIPSSARLIGLYTSVPRSSVKRKLLKLQQLGYFKMYNNGNQGTDIYAHPDKLKY